MQAAPLFSWRMDSWSPRLPQGRSWAKCGGGIGTRPAVHRFLPPLRTLVLSCLLGVCAHRLVAETNSPPQPIVQVELQGRVVCLVEDLHQRYQAEQPTRHEHLWALKTGDGRCYTLLPGKFSEAIFLDQRVRAKDLKIKGRLFPGTQALELTYFRSIKDGVPQDLYYYCEVCAIKTVSPQVCACCQAPVVLVEKPAGQADE